MALSKDYLKKMQSDVEKAEKEYKKYIEKRDEDVKKNNEKTGYKKKTYSSKSEDSGISNNSKTKSDTSKESKTKSSDNTNTKKTGKTLPTKNNSNSDYINRLKKRGASTKQSERSETYLTKDQLNAQQEGFLESGLNRFVSGVGTGLAEDLVVRPTNAIVNAGKLLSGQNIQNLSTFEGEDEASKARTESLNNDTAYKVGKFIGETGAFMSQANVARGFNPVNNVINGISTKFSTIGGGALDKALNATKLGKLVGNANDVFGRAAESIVVDIPQNLIYEASENNDRGSYAERVGIDTLKDFVGANAWAGAGNVLKGAKKAVVNNLGKTEPHLGTNGKTSYYNPDESGTANYSKEKQKASESAKKAAETRKANQKAKTEKEANTYTVKRPTNSRKVEKNYGKYEVKGDKYGESGEVSKKRYTKTDIPEELRTLNEGGSVKVNINNGKVSVEGKAKQMPTGEKYDPEYLAKYHSDVGEKAQAQNKNKTLQDKLDDLSGKVNYYKNHLYSSDNEIRSNLSEEEAASLTEKYKYWRSELKKANQEAQAVKASGKKPKDVLLTSNNRKNKTYKKDADFIRLKDGEDVKFGENVNTEQSTIASLRKQVNSLEKKISNKSKTDQEYFDYVSSKFNSLKNKLYDSNGKYKADLTDDELRKLKKNYSTWKNKMNDAQELLESKKKLAELEYNEPAKKASNTEGFTKEQRSILKKMEDEMNEAFESDRFDDLSDKEFAKVSKEYEDRIAAKEKEFIEENAQKRREGEMPKRLSDEQIRQKAKDVIKDMDADKPTAQLNKLREAYEDAKASGQERYAIALQELADDIRSTLPKTRLSKRKAYAKGYRVKQHGKELPKKSEVRTEKAKTVKEADTKVPEKDASIPDNYKEASTDYKANFVDAREYQSEAYDVVYDLKPLTSKEVEARDIDFEKQVNEFLKKKNLSVAETSAELKRLAKQSFEEAEALKKESYKTLDAELMDKAKKKYKAAREYRLIREEYEKLLNKNDSVKSTSYYTDKKVDVDKYRSQPRAKATHDKELPTKTSAQETSNTKITKDLSKESELKVAEDKADYTAEKKLNTKNKAETDTSKSKEFEELKNGKDVEFGEKKKVGDFEVETPKAETVKEKAEGKVDSAIKEAEEKGIERGLYERLKHSFRQSKLGRAVEKIDSYAVNGQAVISNMARDVKNKNIEGKMQAVRTSKGTVDYILKEGMVDLKGKVINNKSYEQLIEEIPKALREDFNRYAQHLHNIDRTKQGKPVFKDVSTEESQKIVDEAISSNPEFKTYTENINKWWRQFTHTYLVDTGMISEQAWKTMNDMYPNYIPTFRERYDGIRSTISVGNRLSAGSGIKRAKGGELADTVLPLEDTFLIQINNIVKGAKHNDLYTTIINDFIAHPKELASYGKIISNDKVKTSDILDTILNADNKMESILKKEIESGKFTVTAMVDGRKITAEVNRDVAQALNWLDNPIADEALSAITRFGEKVTSYPKKAITGLNPVFAISNIARDIPTLYIQSEHGAIKTTVGLVKAISAMATDSKLWKMLGGKPNQYAEIFEQYKAMGGKQSGYYNQNRGRGEGVKGSYNDAVKGRPIQQFVDNTLGALGEGSETLARLTEFINSVEKYGTSADAITRALDDASKVTVNFSRTASAAKAANAWVMYLNATMQGLGTFGRVVADHPLRTATRSAAIITLPMLVLTAINKDNPNYQDLSDRIKQNYFCIPNMNGDFDEDGNAMEFIKVPLNREYGTLFGASVDVMLKAYNGEEHPAEYFLNETVKNNFLPNNPINNNIFSPIVQNLPNNKDFAGRDIVPSYISGVSPKYEYDASTSGIARKIADVTNYVDGKTFINVPDALKSPMRIDYLIDSYGGYLGDVLQNLTSGDEKNWEDYITQTVIGQVGTEPFINKFTADARYSSGAITKFYDDLEKLSVAKKDYEQEVGNKDAWSEARVKYKVYNEISSQISDSYKREREILASDQMTSKQKETSIKLLREERNKLAKNAESEAIKAAKEYKSSPTYATLNRDIQEKYTRTCGISKETWAKYYTAVSNATKESGGSITEVGKALTLINSGVKKYSDYYSYYNTVGEAKDSTENSYNEAMALYLNGVTYDEYNKIRKNANVDGGSLTVAEVKAYLGKEKSPRNAALFAALTNTSYNPYE